MKAKNLVTASSESSGNCFEKTNAIFLKFSIFYGHIWRGQFKNEYYTDLARKAWAQALKGIDEKLIDQAVDECLKHRVMPPALAQFIECCKQLRINDESFFQKEIYKPSTPIVAQTYLKAIKTILNMKKQN